MIQLTGGAKLIILGGIAAMMISILAVVYLAICRAPIPTALETFPGLAFCGLVGLLGRTRPDPEVPKSNP